jgi:SAM-dependent methyltransferase
MPRTSSQDEPSAEIFYATPRGQVAAGAIAQRVSLIWPDLAGLSVLGIGYPAPFLKAWHGTAYRCLNATSSQHDPAPRGSCSVDAMRLPFPDLAFDRILVIHGVEPYGNDERLLRELWRVLKDDGRLLVVAPNRMGLWAHVDSTPFGQGQPYSQGQIDRLLATGMFRPERRDRALFTPPTHVGLILGLARFWESVGRALAPQLAGVTLTEAVKDVYAAVPANAVSRRMVVLPEAA